MSRYINEFSNPENQELLSRLKSQEAAIQEKASSVKSMMLRLEGNFPAVARPMAIKPAPADPLTLRTIDTVLTSMRNLGQGKLRVSKPHGWEETKTSLDTNLRHEPPAALTETQQYLASLRNQRSSFTRDRIQQRVETLNTMENMRQQAVHLAWQQKAMNIAIQHYTQKTLKQAITRLIHLRQRHFRKTYAVLRCNLRYMKRSLHVMTDLLLRRSDNHIRGNIIHYKLTSRRLMHTLRNHFEEVCRQEVSIARANHVYRDRRLKQAIKSLLWTHTRHLQTHHNANVYAMRQAFYRVVQQLRAKVMDSKRVNMDRYATVIGRLYGQRSSRLILTQFMLSDRGKVCLPAVSSLLLLRSFDRLIIHAKAQVKHRKLSLQADYHAHDKALLHALHKWQVFSSNRKQVAEQNLKRTQVKQSRLFFQHAKTQLYAYLTAWRNKSYDLKSRGLIMLKRLKLKLSSTYHNKKQKNTSVDTMSKLLLLSISFLHFKDKIAFLQDRKKRVMKYPKSLTSKQQSALKLLFLTLRQRMTVNRLQTKKFRLWQKQTLQAHFSTFATHLRQYIKRQRQTLHKAKKWYRNHMLWYFLERLKSRVLRSRDIRSKGQISRKSTGHKKRVFTVMQVRIMHSAMAAWHSFATVKSHRKRLIRHRRQSSYTSLVVKYLMLWRSYPQQVKLQSIKYEDGKRFRLYKVAKMVLRRWLRVSHHVSSPSKLHLQPQQARLPHPAAAAAAVITAATGKPQAQAGNRIGKKYKPFIRHYLKQWMNNIRSVYHYNVTCYTRAQHHHLAYTLRYALITSWHQHYLTAKYTDKQSMQRAEQMAVKRQGKVDLQAWKHRVLQTIHTQHVCYETGKLHYHNRQKRHLLKLWSTYTATIKQKQKQLIRNGRKYHVNKVLIIFLLNWRKGTGFRHQLRLKKKQSQRLQQQRLLKKFFKTAKPFLLHHIQLTHRVTQAVIKLRLTRMKTNFTLFKRKMSLRISNRKLKEKAKKFRGFQLLRKVFIQGLKVNYQAYLDKNETALSQSRQFHIQHANKRLVVILKAHVLRRRQTRRLVQQFLLQKKVKLALCQLWQQSYLTRRLVNKQRDKRGQDHYRGYQYLSCMKTWLTGMMTHRRSLLPLLPLLPQQQQQQSSSSLTINTTGKQLKRSGSSFNNKQLAVTAAAVNKADKGNSRGSSGAAAGVVSQWMKTKQADNNPTLRTTRHAARNLLHARSLSLFLRKWRQRHKLSTHPQRLQLTNAEQFHSHRVYNLSLTAWVKWIEATQTQQTRLSQANQQSFHYSLKTGFVGLVENLQQWKRNRELEKGFLVEKARYSLLKWVVLATGNSHHCFFPSSLTVQDTSDRSCFTLFRQLQNRLKSNNAQKVSLVLTSHRSQSKLGDQADTHRDTSQLHSALKLWRVITRKQRVIREKCSDHRAQVMLHSAISKLLSLKFHHHLQRQLSVINHLREFHLKQALQRLSKHKRLQLARKTLIKLRLLRLCNHWQTLTLKSQKLRKALKFFTNKFHIRDLFLAFHEWKEETRIEVKISRYLSQVNQHYTEIYWNKLILFTKFIRRCKRAHRMAIVSFSHLQRRELFTRLMTMLTRRYHLRDQLKIAKRYYYKQSQFIALRNLLALRRTRIATTYHKKRSFAVIKQQLRVKVIFAKDVKGRYQIADLNCIKRLFARWLTWKDNYILFKFKHGVPPSAKQQQQQVMTGKKVKVELTAQYAAYYQSYGQLRLIRRLQTTRTFRRLVKTQDENLDEYYWFMKAKRGFHKLLRATRKGIRIKKNTFLMQRYHSHLMIMRAIRRWDAKLTAHSFVRVQLSRLMESHAAKMKIKRGLRALIWFSAWREEQKHRKMAKHKPML